jgi:uncharacterized HAD superfamily protein
MRLGIDIDDVLFPWFDKAHAACERAGVTNGANPTRWAMYEDYGITLEDWLAVMDAATLDGSLYTGEPYPGAVEALATLREAGHTLHVVTARGFFQHGDLIRKATVDWLRENDVPHDSLTFTKDKSFVRVDAFVDDSWKNVSDLVAAGIPTWMVDAPHNRDNEYHQRVPSVVEFAQAILGMSA